MELERALHEVFEFLGDKEPRSRLATLDNTSAGGPYASPYDQLLLLKEFLQDFTRVPPQSTMQKESCLLDVLCVLHARAAPLTAPPTTTTSSLVKTPSSTESIALAPSSSTVAVLQSAPDATTDASQYPPPPVPAGSSSLSETTASVPMDATLQSSVSLTKRTEV